MVFFSKKKKSYKCLLSGSKVVFFWPYFHETWSSKKLGTLEKRLLLSDNIQICLTPSQNGRKIPKNCQI